MNINFETFLIQCAAMGVWVFIVAGLYSIVERFVAARFPHFLDLPEEAPASPPPAAETAPRT